LAHKYICELIINPRTERPIDIDTLRKAFELDITMRYSEGPRCRRQRALRQRGQQQKHRRANL